MPWPSCHEGTLAAFLSPYLIIPEILKAKGGTATQSSIGRWRNKGILLYKARGRIKLMPFCAPPDPSLKSSVPSFLWSLIPDTPVFLSPVKTPDSILWAHCSTRDRTRSLSLRLASAEFESFQVKRKWKGKQAGWKRQTWQEFCFPTSPLLLLSVLHPWKLLS